MRMPYLSTFLCLLALTGCVTDQEALMQGMPPLAVNLSALSVCERILQPVQFPPVNAKTDARVAFVRDEAAIRIMQKNIINGRACIADVRRRYANPR